MALHFPGLTSGQNSFLSSFYNVTDTPSSFSSDHTYAEFFTTPAQIIVGPFNKDGSGVRTREGLLELRKSFWTNVTHRHHDVQEAFVHPQRKDLIMLDGRVSQTASGGARTDATFAVRIQFDHVKHDEGYKIKEYDVWVTVES